MSPLSRLRSHPAMLTLGAALLLVLILGLTAAGMQRVAELGQRVEGLVYEYSFRDQLADRVLRVSRDRWRLLRVASVSPDANERAALVARYRAELGGLLAALEALRGAGWPAGSQQDFEALTAALTRADEVGDRAARLLVAGQGEAARVLVLGEAQRALSDVEEVLQRLVLANRDGTRETVALAGRGMRDALLVVSIIGIALLTTGALVAGEVIRRSRRAEEALYREKERAEVTLHSIGDGVITTDGEGRIDFLNSIAEHYTGWSALEAQGRPLAEVYSVVDEVTEQPLSVDLATRSAKAVPGVAMRLVHRNGKGCPIRDSFSPIRDRTGSEVGMVVVFHDVSQIQEMAQRLTWQASHDPLTGLANRREFERRLGELIEIARSQGKQHALLYMDLDNFKAVNDTCGHAAGDELLRQLTTVMSSRVRGSDTLARVGGDEFGVLLESCPPDQALRIANGIREAVRDFRFVWQDRTFGVGLSIGLVPLDRESGDVSRVLAIADTFCYEAKSKGRDRVQVYRPAEDPADLARTDLRVLSQINNAFELDRFRLFRQKIMDLKSGDDRQARYEVLVRMLDRSGNLVPPTGFMPAAERYNLLTSIERWVVTTLVEYLQRQCELGLLPSGPAVMPDTFYAVNLSAASVTDSSFPDFVRKLLTRYNLPRGLLAFEVTETAAISNLTKAAQLMHELKAMGCRFALDDFGIGMSSFAYLKYLPVDYLKIDGVFVRDMANDPMDFAIVEAINRIGHILGLKTVAEYVEDAVTLDRLKWLGVDYAQGYYVAEPEALMPSPEPARAPA